MQFMSQVQDTFLPSQVSRNYFNLEKYFTKNSWHNLSEQDIWEELCFCILSGNVSYELAKSVIEVTRKNGILNYTWMKDESTSEKVLFQELNSPNFKPVKINGELRKYRYPKKRSHQIKNAAIRIYETFSLKNFLKFNDSIPARNFLFNEIPGLGIKEASHFLRNIGYSDSLAIIDIHVFRFLQEQGLIDFSNIKYLTTSKYLLAEKILRNLSEYHSLNLAILDLAIWHYMRNRTQ